MNSTRRIYRLIGPCFSFCVGLPAITLGADFVDRPNFVFILGEGQGWASTSVQLDERNPGSKSDSFSTPNLERLAAQGMRFSSFYAPSPRCTPSRAAYFTGLSPAQLHMTFVSPGGDTGRKLIEPRALLEMPLEATTIAELLQQAGYATAHFGKWHVGRINPRQHGFDESDGATSNGGPDNVRNPNPKQAYSTARRGMDFMSRQVKADKPFYLQVSHYAGRSEDDALPETVEKVLRSGLGRNERNIGAAAVVMDMDITIGMILDKIEELEIADKTFVFYTTDHGTPGRNGPLTGGKGGVWQGGIRVPLFFCGPGIPPGSSAHVRASGVDLFPTVAELAGITSGWPKSLEGGSLVSVLKSGGSGVVKRPRDEFVVHFPHYDRDDDGPASAILLGNYKLVRIFETGERRLFDLSEDLGEQRNLAKALPEKVAVLDGKLTEYLSAVDAQLPTVNQNAASGASPDSRRGGGRRGRSDPIHEALDTNGDGELSADELQNASSVLQRLDRNNDGKLTRDELRSTATGDQ